MLDCLAGFGVLFVSLTSALYQSLAAWASLWWTRASSSGWTRSRGPRTVRCTDGDSPTRRGWTCRHVKGEGRGLDLRVATRVPYHGPRRRINLNRQQVPRIFRVAFAVSYKYSEEYNIVRKDRTTIRFKTRSCYFHSRDFVFFEDFVSHLEKWG